jgi:hypothetical protein
MWKASNFQDITFDFGRNFSPIEEYVILWFYNIFIKTNSPSTTNRNGRISKSELYHTSQQLSQHDCPIRIFSHKHKLCIWNKLHTSIYHRDVMNMLTFQKFKCSVVQKGVFVYHEEIAGIK